MILDRGKTYLISIRKSFRRLMRILSGTSNMHHPLLNSEDFHFDRGPSNLLEQTQELEVELKNEFEGARAAATEILANMVHRSETERRRMELIFDSIDRAILLIDPDCRITAANRTTRQLFGTKSIGIVGKYLSDLLPESYTPTEIEYEYQSYCKHIKEFNTAFQCYTGMDTKSLEISSTCIDYDTLAGFYSDYLRTQKTLVGSRRSFEFLREDGAKLNVVLSLNVLAIDPFSLDFGYLISIEDRTERNKVNAEVSRLQNITEDLLSITPIPTFHKDSQLKFTSVNNMFKDLVQLDNGDIIGKTAADMFDADSAARLTALDAEALSSDGSKVDGFTLHTLAGSSHPARVFTCAIRDKGIAVGVSGAIMLGSASDDDPAVLPGGLTADARNAIFEAAARAIVFFDSSLVVTGCNDEFTRLVGKSKDEIIGISGNCETMRKFVHKNIMKQVSDIVVIGGKPIRRRSLPLLDASGDFEGLVCIYFTQFGQE